MNGPVRGALAGAAYAISLFLVGSAIGVVRVLALEPHLGALEATVLELPLMLGIAWLICASLVNRCAISARTGDRLLMGGIALFSLIAAEYSFGLLLGRPLDYRNLAAMLGLAGQIAAALLPLVQACLFPRRPRALP